MATKNADLLETFSSPKSSSADKQFNNLNLNQNYNSVKQCDELLLGSKSANVNGKQQWNNGSYNQTGYNNGQVQHMIRKYESKISLHSSDSVNKSKVLTKTSSSNSTLSLHIAAYENSFMASKNDNAGEKTKKFKTKCDKMLAGNPASPFELPRQQREEDAKEKEPEIMQFKASQKLMPPNHESTTASGEHSSNKTVEQPEMKSNEDNQLKTAEENKTESAAGLKEGANRAESEQQQSDKAKKEQPQTKSTEDESDDEMFDSAKLDEYRKNAEKKKAEPGEKNRAQPSAECQEGGNVVKRESVTLPDDFDTMKHQYKFQDKIGEGCDAKVYKVTTEQQRELALKITPCGYGLWNDCAIMKMAAEIQSPHICKLEDAGKLDEKNYFTALDLLGPTLVEKVKGASNVQLLIIAKQSLKGIADLHTLGYAHRDIKSDNFAVGRIGSDKEQVVYIIDFGISKSIRKAEAEKVPGEYDEYEEIPLKKDDLFRWFQMVLKWFNVLIWHEYRDKFNVQLRLAGDPKIREKNMAKLREIKQELQGFRYIYMKIREIKTNDSIDYDFISNILDLMIQEEAQFSAIEWETGKLYVEPQASKKDGEFDLRFFTAYYEKKPNAKNAIIHYLGDALGFRSGPKNSKRGPKTLTVFQCRPSSNETCKRTMEVYNYDPDKVKDGDDVEIYVVKNQHTCSKHRKINQETIQQKYYPSDGPDFTIFN